jgi:mannose-6-phosphate isomerase-like protein (cupin superfamily)
MRRLSSIAVLVLGFTLPAVSHGDPGFQGELGTISEQNTDFRRVIFTGRNIQIVAMALAPGEEIGEEAHDVDQCFFFVAGMAQATTAGRTKRIGKDGALCVPAGTRHNIRNAGRDSLKLFTIYAPPQHPAGTVHRTKAEAQRAEAASHETE